MPLALIVEDNELNRKLLRDILEIHFDVDVVHSAEEAQTYLQSKHPDIVMLDLQLPGMNGLELTRILKQSPETKDLPIVAISAHAMQENIDAAKIAGCVEYVTKPILEDPDAFADRMLKLVTDDQAYSN